MSDRVALVQGASRGIGAGFARALLDDPRYATVFATARRPERSEVLGELAERHPERLVRIPLDVRDDAAVAAAAGAVAERCPRLHLLVNCAGVLQGEGRPRPEKRLEDLDAAALADAFAVNAVGPALVARSFLPLLRHDERAVLANLSARVGSIGDNRLGGWYGYRASKAAQNMLTRTLAIELARRAPNVVCLALHPGTVDTDLSRPFQRNVPAERLFPVERAVRQLLGIVETARPEESGAFLAWDRSPIPW